jgi:hypothetical protein
MDVYDFTTGEPKDFLSSEQINIRENLLYPLAKDDIRYIYLKTDPGKKFGDLVCSQVEVYEMKINYNQVSPPCGLPKQGHSFRFEGAEEKAMCEFMTKLFDSVSKRLTLSRAKIYFVEQILLNLDREVSFLAKYFHSC